MFRKFTEQHLGMIKAVYPDSYDLKYEILKQPLSRDETLELIVDRTKSTCTNISERKKIFDKLLLDKAKLHHQVWNSYSIYPSEVSFSSVNTVQTFQEFLQTLDPPLIVPLDMINRWHPLFDLNTVPDIVPVSIPRPTINNEAPLSVKEFLGSFSQR